MPRDWATRGDLFTTDIEGTRNLAEAAADAGVKRFLYMSHLGADRMSAFAVHKAKGIAEEHIRRSGVPFTILRSSIVYGPEDHFTVPLTRLLRAAPGIFPLPGGGRAVIQPLWIEDLVTCILWAFENPEMENQTYEIGGSEYFPLRQVLETIMEVNRRKRRIVPLSMPKMRALIILLGAMNPNFPFSSYSLDYFSINRTCPVDNLTRAFGLMPARFTYRLDYLRRTSWTDRLSRWFTAQTKEIRRKITRAFPCTAPTRVTTIRLLETPEEMTAVEELQRAIWPGSEIEIVPAHLLITAIHNGGLLLGAFEADRMVGFLFGFPGLESLPDGPHPKHCSHMLGVLDCTARGGHRLCAQARPVADGPPPGSQPHHLDL